MDNQHNWQSVPDGASRSPCPALNSLANHGYLPGDGKRISFWKLVSAVTHVYNISYPLAIFMALGGFINCCHQLDLTIDLHDLTKRGKLEHDGSLVHPDALPSAEYADGGVDEVLLEKLVAESKDGRSLDLEDLIRARMRRDADIVSHPMDTIHSLVSRGELALILAVIGDGTFISTDRIRRWLGEERLPNDWAKPESPVGFTQVIPLLKRIAASIRASKAGREKGII